MRRSVLRAALRRFRRQAECTPPSTMCVGPLKPWVCSYDGRDGLRYGIRMYATDPEQILTDWRYTLDNLTIDGLLHEVIDAPS